MGMLGSAVGTFAGGKIGKHFAGKTGENIGKVIGGVAGGLLPYKTGGMVKGKRGKPVQIMAHGSEYILPVGVRPTKHQKAQVAKRKKKAMKR